MYSETGHLRVQKCSDYFRFKVLQMKINTIVPLNKSKKSKMGSKMAFKKEDVH